MKLGLVVQHHPSRADLLPALLAALDGYQPTVVVDEPHDHPNPDTWAVHRRCLQAMPDDATHLLIVQDDALPQPGWQERAATLIGHHPSRLLCLFTPGFGYLRRRVLEAKKVGGGACDIPVMAFVPIVATVYPAALALDIVAWSTTDGRARRRIQRRAADDGVVAQWCQHRKIVPLASVPCLFDHDDQVPSVHRPMKAGAHRRAALL